MSSAGFVGVPPSLNTTVPFAPCVTPVIRITSLVSGSLSFDSRLAARFAVVASSFTEIASSTASTWSFTPLIVTVTVAVSVEPWPSDTV